MDELVTYRVCKQDARYHVGDDGSFYGPSGRIKGFPNQYGYLLVRIRQKAYLISRLVCEHFNGDSPFPGAQACHFPDPCKTNNKASNLKWGTNRQNAAHSVEQGLIARGENNARCTISDDVARMIITMLRVGVRVREVGKSFRVSEETVSAINTGASWAWLSGATQAKPVNHISKPRKTHKNRGRPNTR